MTVISKRVFRPIAGKEALAHRRIKRLSEVLARAGGRVRMSSVAWGDGARDVHLYGVFENVESGAKTATAMMADPDFAALRAESENDPASNWEGPEVWRCIFGEPQPRFPVMLQRDYQMPRRHLKSALALLPEIQALQPDTPLLALTPVISGDMGRLMVVYYAASLVELGERIDRVGMSAAFQAIVERAAEFGTLTKSRALINM